MALSGILLYLFFLYIRPQDWVPFFLGWRIDFFLYALIIIGSIINGEFYFNWKNKFYQIFMLWIVVVFVSNMLHGNYDIAITFAYMYVRFFIIFICLFSSINNPFRIKAFVWTTILLLSILSLQNHDLVRTGVGWAQQGLGWGDEPRARWVGLWNGMGSYALIFVAAFPFMLWYCIYSRSVMLRIVYAGLAFWLFYGAYLTRARGALIAFLCLFAVYFLDRYRGLKSVILIGSIAVGFFAIAPGRFTDFDDKSNSASNRIEVWDKGYEMITHSPLLGIGRGEYARYTGRLVAHNSFLEIAGETGFIGLTLWLSLLYLSFKGLGQALAKATDDLKPIIRGLIYCLIGYQLSSFFVTTEFELLYIYEALAATVATGLAGNIEFTKKDLRNVLLIAVGGLVFFRIMILVFWRIYG